MKGRWVLAVAMGLLITAAAQAQIPVGNQSTFGRGAAGRSYPFLNGHGYSSTVDAGRSYGVLNGHGYSTTTDPGLPYTFLNGHGYGLTQSTSTSTPATEQPHIAVTSLDTSPTVPLAFKAPAGLIFE